MPGNETQPLFAAAQELGVGFHLGYAEMVIEDDGSKRYFNTAVIVDRAGQISGKYRKVHIPGHAEPQPGQIHQHLEKRYFEPGDLGIPRVPHHGRHHGDVHLQRPALARDLPGDGSFRASSWFMLGYNTPSTNPFAKGQEAPHLGMFHNHLSMQAGAYQKRHLGGGDGQGRHGGRDPPHGRELHHRAHRGDRGSGPDRGRRDDRCADRSGTRGLHPRDHLQLRRTSADRALRSHFQPGRRRAAASLSAAGRRAASEGEDDLAEVCVGAHVSLCLCRLLQREGAVDRAGSACRPPPHPRCRRAWRH